MNEKYIELSEKLTKLQRLFRKQQMHSSRKHGPMSDPTRGQGRVLAMLNLQPEISTKDLSYVLGIRQQSLNELLSKLEKGGYITREPAETDKRIMMVKLTEKGRQEQPEEVHYEDIFSCLNDQELNNFDEYLTRVISAFEEKFGAMEDDDVHGWMNSARSRMSEREFAQLMAMRNGHFGHRHGHGSKKMWKKKFEEMEKEGIFPPDFEEAFASDHEEPEE